MSFTTMPENKIAFIARATFKGANGSLGYTAETTYRLNLHQPDGGAIIIQRMDGTGQKRYESLFHFLSSWAHLELMG